MGSPDEYHEKTRDAILKAERITDKGRIIAAVLGALLLILLCSYALWARPPEIAAPD